jgi:hypothetical protein
MASIITATTTSGLTQSADNSGVLQLASGTGNLVTVPSVTGTAMVSGNMPAFSATNNATQTLTNAVSTKVALQVETFDTNSCFDSTTNYRFTPNVAGYYQINAIVYMYATGTSKSMSYTTSIYKNGSMYLRQAIYLPALQTQDYSGVVTDVIYFNGSTDYVELYANITDFTSGLGGAIPGGGTYVRFSGSMVRAA